MRLYTDGMERSLERSADQAHPVRPTNFWASVAAWRWALRHRVPARISVKSWIDGSIQ
jgi:hypothetical protein